MQEVTNYKGFTITIYHDGEDSAHLDPYNDGDYMVPMAINGGRNFCSHNYGEALEGIAPSTAQYRRHKKALWEAIGEDPAEVAKDYAYSANDLENYFADKLHDLRSDQEFDTLETIGRILGIPCLSSSSSGYCQGDYVDVLVVWTPEFEKITGVTKKQAAANNYAMLRSNVKTWGAWAWGDVYGWKVEDPDGEEVDRCGGYLCPDMETDYLEADARDAVDSYWEEKTRTHRLKLTKWIKNRVPLSYRTACPQPPGT